MDSAFESATLLSLRYPARTCLSRKGMSRLRNSKIKMLSQTHGMTSTSDSQNQKSHTAVEKASSSSGKGKWRTYSAHFLLIISLVIWPTVTFWHSLRTSGNANDEPLAKIALWCVMLFCLYHS